MENTPINKLRFGNDDTYLTLPPQNWHSDPCQPSGQRQVPFLQTPPFMQRTSLHLPGSATPTSPWLETSTVGPSWHDKASITSSARRHTLLWGLAGRPPTIGRIGGGSRFLRYLDLCSR
uniref:Uncharacterized protein n=1 Tax=Anopheles coluzzii TaxID=1518534 RepID=A0A8W7PAM6_ANOCL